PRPRQRHHLGGRPLHRAARRPSRDAGAHSGGRRAPPRARRRAPGPTRGRAHRAGRPGDPADPSHPGSGHHARTGDPTRADRGAGMSPRTVTADDRVRAVLYPLDGVGLDELVDTAALLTRVDRKYVLPVDDALTVLGALAPT